MKAKLLLVLVALTFVCPVFGQSDSAKRVAILETVDKEGKVSYGIKLMVRSKLSAAITATPGYESYDRVDVSSILGEQEFQRTGLVSDKDIKQLGEMIGVNYILVAEVAYLDDSYIFLSAKILNVETARVEQIADAQTQATVEALEQNCKVLAAKLLNVNIAPEAVIGTGTVITPGTVRGELTIDGNKYAGEYLNGKPHGRGIIYFSSEDKRKSYEGDWVNGIREGNGTMIWNNGEKYVGQWKNGVRNGNGTDYYASGNVYEGNWSADKRHGKGTYTWKDGVKYVGEWKNGAIEGYGVYYSAIVYEGNWLAGKRHGKGKMTFAPNDSHNRKYYDGEWVNGVRQGTGTMVWNNGDKYVGNWLNGAKSGMGVYYYQDGCRFDGGWLNDKKNGIGTYYWTNGGYEKGNYIDDKEDGEHEQYDKKGKHIATMTYNKGERIREQLNE